MKASILLCFWLEHVQLECDYSPPDEWKSPKGTDGISFVREPLTVASEQLQIKNVARLNFATGWEKRDQLSRQLTWAASLHRI